MFTVQSFAGSGFSIVRYSVKPAPTFPSAKYQILLTGPVTVEDGVPVGEGLGDGEEDGVGDGVVVADGVADGVPVGDAVTLADGLAVGVGGGVLPVIVKLFV